MMRPYPALVIVLPLLAGLGTAVAGTELDALLEQTAFRDTIRSRNEGALLEESTALEQAQTQARSRSDYGLELRPSLGENDAGIGLRVYMPDRWSRKRLQEQLTLAATSEQLRIASLEWADVVSVYRNFCSYRMHKNQLALLDQELRFIEPYLNQADQAVELNQMTVADRARLYSSYLAVANDYTNLQSDDLATQRQLRMVLGPLADLEKLSAMALVSMPSQLEINSLLRTALERRADFRRLDLNIRAMQLAEDAARTEDGFRLKYIQPSYNVDLDDGSDRWEISAAIVLPWGTRNPDIAVYQRQQTLSLAARDQQERLIEDRLRVMLGTADAYYAQATERQRRINPVVDRLHADLQQLGEVPLDQVRDIISIRERMLEVSLQSTKAKYREEILAIDLAEELGGW